MAYLLPGSSVSSSWTAPLPFKALNFSKLTFLDTTDTVLASFKSEMKLGEPPDGFKDRVLAHELSTWLVFKCFIRKLTNNRRI